MGFSAIIFSIPILYLIGYVIFFILYKLESNKKSSDAGAKTTFFQEFSARGMGGASGVKNGKYKKPLLIGLAIPLLIIAIVYPSLLLLNALPVKSTDLSKTNIKGYQVHQKIEDEFIQPDFYISPYEVYEHDDICDFYNLHPNDNSLQIMIYKKGDRKGHVFSLTAYASEMGNINRLGDLEVGNSKFDQVVNKYGGNYRNVRFSTVYSKVIQYEDKINKISLRLCFINDQLECAILKSL